MPSLQGRVWPALLSCQSLMQLQPEACGGSGELTETVTVNNHYLPISTPLPYGHQDERSSVCLWTARSSYIDVCI